jgi:hypothetical protein
VADYLFFPDRKVLKNVSLSCDAELDDGGTIYVLFIYQQTFSSASFYPEFAGMARAYLTLILALNTPYISCVY